MQFKLFFFLPLASCDLQHRHYIICGNVSVTNVKTFITFCFAPFPFTGSELEKTISNVLISHDLHLYATICLILASTLHKHRNRDVEINLVFRYGNDFPNVEHFSSQICTHLRKAPFRADTSITCQYPRHEATVYLCNKEDWLSCGIHYFTRLVADLVRNNPNICQSCYTWTVTLSFEILLLCTFHFVHAQIHIFQSYRNISLRLTGKYKNLKLSKRFSLTRICHVKFNTVISSNKTNQLH